ncbi:hypothetical protein [Flavobacterium psychrotrophum]|uniref:hypothetical protein n=1 Tax=Flavobacterium psychrotrophum TaxID=2294119 RepID=UPI000E31F0C3|nr:hypothetical protein [Flavobacterium psychrotrophum]
MKLYDFLILTEQQQYQAVWDEGTHVDTLACDGVTCLLYAVNDFFVEVRYIQEDNTILGKTEFKQGEHLDKYLFR